jgi:AraC-like DNA-binding protein
MEHLTFDQPSEVHFLYTPLLQDVEVRYSRYSKAAFHKHTHLAHSIGVITRGETNFTLYSSGQEEKIPARAGEVVLINPAQVHACNPLPGSDFAYYMLYIGAGFVERLNRPDENLVFSTPLLRDPWLHSELLTHCKLLFQAERQIRAAVLQDLLANIFFLYAESNQPAENADPDAGRLELARQHLLNHLSEDTPLQTLAQISGLSPYYFVRAFHQRYGLPPHTYKLQERIHLAMRQLKDGQPLAQIALQAGFADQSHFTRKFKTLVGTTPGHYRQEILKSGGSAQ